MSKLATSLWEAIEKQALPKVKEDLTLEVDDYSMSYSYGSEEGTHVDIHHNAYLENITTLEVSWVDDGDEIPWGEVDTSKIELHDLEKVDTGKLTIEVQWGVEHFEATRSTAPWPHKNSAWQCKAIVRPTTEVV